MEVIQIKVRDARVIARFREDSVVESELQPRQICLVEHDGDLELAKVKSTLYAWEDEIPPEK